MATYKLLTCGMKIPKWCFFNVKLPMSTPWIKYFNDLWNVDAFFCLGNHLFLTYPNHSNSHYCFFSSYIHLCWILTPQTCHEHILLICANNMLWLVESWKCFDIEFKTFKSFLIILSIANLSFKIIISPKWYISQ